MDDSWNETRFMANLTETNRTLEHSGPFRNNYGSFFIAGPTLIINIYMLNILLRVPSLHSTVNSLMASLCVQGIIMGIMLLAWIPQNYIVSEPTVCLLFSCMNLAVFVVNMFHFGAISVERYVFFVHPFVHLRFTTKKNFLKYVLAVLWITPCTLSYLPFFVRSKQNWQTQCLFLPLVCPFWFLGTLYIGLLGTVSAFSCFSYYKIFKLIRRKLSATSPLPIPANKLINLKDCSSGSNYTPEASQGLDRVFEMGEKYNKDQKVAQNQNGDSEPEQNQNNDTKTGHKQNTNTETGRNYGFEPDEDQMQNIDPKIGQMPNCDYHVGHVYSCDRDNSHKESNDPETGQTQSTTSQQTTQDQDQIDAGYFIVSQSYSISCHTDMKTFNTTSVDDIGGNENPGTSDSQHSQLSLHKSRPPASKFRSALPFLVLFLYFFLSWCPQCVIKLISSYQNRQFQPRYVVTTVNLVTGVTSIGYCLLFILSDRQVRKATLGNLFKSCRRST